MSTQGRTTLAIETSNPPGPNRTGGAGVAILRGHEPIARAQLASSASHDDALVHAIDRCAHEAGLLPAQLDRIAVSVGPGGYTSVRIAVTVAKTLARVTGAECVPVPTAMSVIRALEGEIAPDRRTLVCLAWKRGDAWAQPFIGSEPEDLGAVRTLEELAEAPCDLMIADDPLADAIRAEFPSFEVETRRPVFEPVALGRASVGMPPVEPAHLLPLYPREPEAKRLWEQPRA